MQTGRRRSYSDRSRRAVLILTGRRPSHGVHRRRSRGAASSIQRNSRPFGRALRLPAKGNAYLRTLQKMARLCRGSERRSVSAGAMSAPSTGRNRSQKLWLRRTAFRPSIMANIRFAFSRCGTWRLRLFRPRRDNCLDAALTFRAGGTLHPFSCSTTRTIQTAAASLGLRFHVRSSLRRAPVRHRGVSPVR